MRDLTVEDPTQRALLPELARTERLLARAASRESGSSCDAEVVALSDLGVSNNVARMIGGFFTGALYRWEASVPIVPIDATVNVCSVSLHRVLSAPQTQADYLHLIGRALARCGRETGYEWNLDVGNHFASLGAIRDSEVLPDGDYLLLHASAAEYKRTPHGLYPTPEVWFADSIRSVDDGERPLRYLAGQPAERFIALAHSLVDYNMRRHEILAELIAGELGVDLESCLPHYGMPDLASVAIGCHWLDFESTDWFVLLTEPDADVLLIAPEAGGSNVVQLDGDPKMLTPHGLGVRSTTGQVEIKDRTVRLNGTGLTPGASVLASGGTELRSLREDPGLRDHILTITPGRVVGRFTPNFSYHRGNNMLEHVPTAL